MTASTILDRELETYRREFPKLKDQVGKFALIKGDNVLSVWSSFDDAIQQGYRECGIDQPFLIKKVETQEPTPFRQWITLTEFQNVKLGNPSRS